MHQYNPYMLTFRGLAKFYLFPLSRPVNQLSFLVTDGLENLCLCSCVCVKYGVSLLAGEIQKEIKFLLWMKGKRACRVRKITASQSWS